MVGKLVPDQGFDSLCHYHNSNALYLYLIHLPLMLYMILTVDSVVT